MTHRTSSKHRHGFAGSTRHADSCQDLPLGYLSRVNPCMIEQGTRAQVRLATAGLATAGLATAGLATAGLATARQATVGQTPIRQASVGATRSRPTAAPTLPHRLRCRVGARRQEAA